MTSSPFFYFSQTHAGQPITGVLFLAWFAFSCYGNADWARSTVVAKAPSAALHHE